MSSGNLILWEKSNIYFYAFPVKSFLPLYYTTELLSAFREKEKVN
jgi:hypothetical protein